MSEPTLPTICRIDTSAVVKVHVRSRGRWPKQPGHRVHFTVDDRHAISQITRVDGKPSTRRPPRTAHFAHNAKVLLLQTI